MPVLGFITDRLCALRYVVKRETAQIVGLGPQTIFEWEKRFFSDNNQKVGLEAAIQLKKA